MLIFYRIWSWLNAPMCIVEWWMWSIYPLKCCSKSLLTWTWDLWSSVVFSAKGTILLISYSELPKIWHNLILPISDFKCVFYSKNLSYRFRKAAYEKRFWQTVNFYNSRLPIGLLKTLLKLGTQFLSLQHANFFSWNSQIFPIIRQSHLKYLSVRDSQMNEQTFENIVFGSESLEKLSIGGM